jgi:hypothetical protein
MLAALIAGCTAPTAPPPRTEAPLTPIPESVEQSAGCPGMSGLAASQLVEPFAALAQRVNESMPEGCVKTAGCPKAVSLPACEQSLLACKQLTTPEAFHPRARKQLGQKVVVRGQLVRLRHLTTALDCAEDRCCNRSRAVLAVGNAADAVMLLDAGGPGAFNCLGDESANCCVVEPGGEIAAIGVVSAYKLGHGLTRVELCAVSPPTKNEEASQ